MSKRGKIFLSTLLFIIIIFAMTASMIFYKASYKTSLTKVPYTAADKVKGTLLNGHSLELSEEELNGIIDIFFKEERLYNSFKIKGIDAALKDGKLQMYIPVSYSGVNFLLTSEGLLSYEKEKVYYKPTYFKIGKIKLPKNYVLEKIKRHFGKYITLENNNIAIDKNLIPLDIKAIAIKDGKVTVDVEKSSVTLKDKLKSMPKTFSKLISLLGIKTDSITEKEKGISKEKTETKIEPSKSSEKVIMDNKNSPERERALDSITSGLNAAMGSVTTGGQRAVIGQMMSVINNMKGNPSYNPYSASGSVRAAYNTLSTKEKQELKAAVFSNIDMSAVNILSSMMGN